MTNTKILGNYNIDNFDISALICKLSDITNETHANEITDVLYHLQSYAQNEYNRDMWRTFYNALILITDKYTNNLECITEV